MIDLNFHKYRKPQEHLPTGGGKAAAAGIDFQASVAALFASWMVAEKPVDSRIHLNLAKPVKISLESLAKVDDIVITLDNGGSVFIQCKTRLTLSDSTESVLSEVIGQFVQQLVSSLDLVEKGTGKGLCFGRDALVLAVGRDAPNTIKSDLATALSQYRLDSDAILNSKQRNAFNKVRKLVQHSVLELNIDSSEEQIDDLLKYIYVIDFDFSGPHREIAILTLEGMLKHPRKARTAFSLLERTCLELMARRGAVETVDLRLLLEEKGFSLGAPDRFKQDVDKLKTITEEAIEVLSQRKSIILSGEAFFVKRELYVNLQAAVTKGSFLLVGEPGTGKSTALSNLALNLSKSGHETMLVTARQIVQGESFIDITRALGLAHPFDEVLANWPGIDEAYLLIDGLDSLPASTMKSLIRQLTDKLSVLPGQRWKLIASIRTFDLHLNSELKEIFEGAPVDQDNVSNKFPNVKHFYIDEWSEKEFRRLLSDLPNLGSAARHFGNALLSLIKIPFNTSLLADLLSRGLSFEDIGKVETQNALLDLVWERRIQDLGTDAEFALKAIISKMVERNQLQIDKFDLDGVSGAILDKIIKSGLLEASLDGYSVQFRHDIVFDYVAGRIFIRLNKPKQFVADFGKRRDLGLLLAPALSFALQKLWNNSGRHRDEFWQTIIFLLGSEITDPIVRSVIARAGCELPKDHEDLQGFVDILTSIGDRQLLAFQALEKIVHSLPVLLGDYSNKPVDMWVWLSGKLVDKYSETVYVLFDLLSVLLGKVPSTAESHDLGRASRYVFSKLFDDENAAHLMVDAITMVCRTFATDCMASASCIEQLLTQKRVLERGHIELPIISEQMRHIAKSDKDLALKIYFCVFTLGTSSSVTAELSPQQISFLSNESMDDLELAQYSLVEFFPRMIKLCPVSSIDAVILIFEVVMKNLYRVEYETVTGFADETKFSLVINKSPLSNLRPKPVIIDYIEKLLNLTIRYLHEADSEKLLDIASHLLRTNRLGVIWAHLFSIFEKRDDVNAKILLPYVTHPEFLKAQETKVQSVRLLTKLYPQVDKEHLESFERSILAELVTEPPMSRHNQNQYPIDILIGIGADHLVSMEAQTVLAEYKEERPSLANATSVTYTESRFDQLESKYIDLVVRGVDIYKASNHRFLETVERVLSELNTLENLGLDEHSQIIPLLEGYQEALFAISDGVASEVLWAGISLIIRMYRQVFIDTFNSNPPESKIVQLSNNVLHLLNQLPEDTHAENSLLTTIRCDGIDAIMRACYFSLEASESFHGLIESFAASPNLMVRERVAHSLVFVHRFNPLLRWKLTELLTNNQNESVTVITGVLSWLLSAPRADSERTMKVASTLIKEGWMDGKTRIPAHNGLAELIFVLWVRDGELKAKNFLNDWINQSTYHKNKLLRGIHVVRSFLAHGFKGDNPDEIAARKRAHNIVLDIVTEVSRCLQNSFRDDGGRLPGRSVMTHLRIIDQITFHCYYAIHPNASGRGEGLPLFDADRNGKKYFLEIQQILYEIADVCGPRARLFAMKLLSSLVSSIPEKVFDLFTQFLLKANRAQLSQLRLIGSKEALEMIKMFLDDYPLLFEDSARASSLVDCVALLSEAGELSASRLLQDLPQLLRQPIQVL